MTPTGSRAPERSGISIVIATFERVDDLGRTLQSIRKQTLPPEEVVVVDDSRTDVVERLVERAVASSGPPVRYVRNPGPAGLPRSRNEGVRRSMGEIVVFLDDDVILDPDYLETAAGFLDEHPDAMGVQGYWLPDEPMNLRDRLLNAFDRVFLQFHYEPGACRVLPNFNNTYPLSPGGPLPCQWLSGCNQVYRREVFEHAVFDENLRRYGYKEDVDFSFRLWKRRPDSLFLLPDARLVHLGSPEARLPSRMGILMKSAHSLYLLHKNMQPGLGGRAAFIYSKLGEGLRQSALLLFGARRNRRARLVGLRHWVAAQFTCIRRRGQIRRGDLAFVTEGST